MTHFRFGFFIIFTALMVTVFVVAVVAAFVGSL